ncbi:MAG TPA: hypothetical protein VI306_10370 [Pyrinomonadaceae bacterium]
MRTIASSLAGTAANRLRQKYDALKKSVLSRVRSKFLQPDDAAEDARKKFTNALDSFSEFFANLNKGMSENAQLKRFVALGENLRNSGYLAGRWGIREPEIGEIAEMHVRITKGLIEEECQSVQRKLNSEVEILKTIKRNAEQDYETKDAYCKKINRAYEYSQRQFSLLLGVMYGFFALVLFVADIPLALELTNKGFNLNADPNTKLRDLFMIDAPDGIFNFFRILAGNWEVVLLAVGVAFCTIYIKIFYDDFIAVPLENLIKKASESPRADYEEFYHPHHGDQKSAESTKEVRKTKAEIAEQFNRLWTYRFFVKLAVLIILLTTILVLGYFRYSVETTKSLKEISAPATFLTYTLMTLIFPIVSGICSSLSLNNFHNWRARRSAKKHNSRAEKALRKATRKLLEKEDELERSSGFIKWLADPETAQKIKNYLVHCYQSGFKFGYLHPEWGLTGDLFTRAEALRNRNLVDPTKLSTNGHASHKPIEMLKN